MNKIQITKIKQKPYLFGISEFEFEIYLSFGFCYWEFTSENALCITSKNLEGF
jgi:hypothetical protein